MQTKDGELRVKKWIRQPGPGQVRGQGDWFEVVGDRMLADYDYCKETGYLPVAESEEMPKESVDNSEEVS